MYSGFSHSDKGFCFTLTEILSRGLLSCIYHLA